MGTATRLGAFDALQRGILSLRSNWELVAVIFVQTLVLMALGLASLLPFYLVLDLELPDLEAPPEQTATWLVETLGRLEAQLTSPALWLAVLSSSAVMLALMLCYSFFQSGVFGVLTVADRQAPRDTSQSGAFRAYSWAEFQASGGRHLWSFFWLFNLMLLLWLMWTLLGGLVALVAGVAMGAGGVPAALAIGCAAFFPLAFLVVLMIFWQLFAQAAIVEENVGAWQGLKVGLQVAMRRLGAVVILFIIMIFVSFAIAMVFLVLSLPVSSGLIGFGGLQLTANLLLQAVQWMLTAVLQLTVAGAVVAIGRGERAVEESDAVATGV